jgi:mycothiol synthase
MENPGKAPQLTIRDFDGAADYPARVRVHNATFPSRPVSEEELRNWDDREDPDPKYLSRHLVGELPGAGPGGAPLVVASLWYGHRPGLYHPRKLHFNLAVHPEYRRRGVGSAMYERMLTGVRPFDPIQIMTGTFEDQRGGLEFLGKRRFVERMRAWVSFLDVARFDPSPFRGVFERIESEDIAIRSEEELSADPEFERKLHDMFVEVLQDVPAPDPIKPPTFERFVESRRNDINRIPEAFLVAVHLPTGVYAGTTSLWKMHAADFLSTGLTGVRRAFRRKGIALALKLRTLEYAGKTGAPRIRTDNESGNRAMLSINEMLGFQRHVAEIALARSLASGSGSEEA